MHHPLLGLLKADQGSLVGSLSLNEANISLRIDPDDVSIDHALSLAATIASSLCDYDRISKDVIVRDLLKTYNEGWNEYDEVQENGSTIAVVNPQLGHDEFRDKLELVSLDITGDSCVELWYKDSGLFWGHSIFVQSFDGADFSNSQAQLFG